MNILFSSATQLAAAIRAGHVSAVEVLEAHLAQIDRHNPALNAIITLALAPVTGEFRQPPGYAPIGTVTR